MPGFSALPADAVEAGAPTQWLGTSKVLGPGFLKMPVLTIGMLGLQIIWSVEMSYASPYLLSLGMSKSLMSIVFLAGPLSGLIVAPLIGVLSDHSHSRFGRRRPYMLFGALISFAAMYLLGFTREFASVVTTRGSTTASANIRPAILLILTMLRGGMSFVNQNNALTIGLAVFSIYCIDFSINVVQAMDRALLVDILPVSEQERGNAWAGRMFGLGGVLGFFVGNVDLTPSLAFLGNTQLEILCVITSCVLMITHLVTIFHVKERVLVKATDGTHAKFGLWHAIKDIWGNFLVLPKTIQRICVIQLFAWIGWFPVLFWTSLYIGELHKRNSPTPDTDDAKAALNSEATRLGSRALLCSALASLFASIVCPFFVSDTNDSRSGRRERNRDEYENRRLGGLKKVWDARPTCHLATLWAASHGTFSICMLSTFWISNVSAGTVVMTVAGLSLAITNWAPFALIAETIHTASLDSSPQYVLGDVEDDSDDDGGIIPLRDARTTRASEEMSLGDADEARRLISEVKEHERENTDENGGQGKTNPSKMVHFEVSESESRTSSDIAPLSTRLGSNFDAQQSQVDGFGGSARSDSRVDEAIMQHGVTISTAGHSIINNENSIEDNAGIILGIHNVFIVIPQFIITGISSIIFAVMDPGKSVLTSHASPAHPETLASGRIESNAPGHDPLSMRSILLPRAAEDTGVGSANSVGVIFRIGGVSAAVACVLSLRLARELKRSR